MNTDIKVESPKNLFITVQKEKSHSKNLEMENGN